MGSNVLQLPEGGDFEALHCQPSRNFDRSTKLDLTTEPPLLGRCCVRPVWASGIEDTKLFQRVPQSDPYGKNPLQASWWSLLVSRKLVYREVFSAPKGWLCQRKRDYPEGMPLAQNPVPR